MSSVVSERPRARCRFRLLGAVIATIAFAAGLSAVAVVVESESTPAAASTIGFSQCNGHAADALGAALTETCSITITNNISLGGGTSSSSVISAVCTLGPCVTQSVGSSDVINAVHQCNNSNIEGGSTTICSVHIINNISLDGASPATALTVRQCIGSGTGDPPTLMTGCIPSSQGSPTVDQCNGSGTGGGGAMTCNASGMISADFPIFIDQCNDSETGGGSFVTCTVLIETFVIDTSIPDTPPTGGPGDTPPTGTPGGGTPGTGTPGTPETGTPGTPGTGTPGTPGTGTPPFVEVPPNYTG
jgi:hypothetical protein